VGWHPATHNQYFKKVHATVALSHELEAVQLPQEPRRDDIPPYIDKNALLPERVFDLSSNEFWNQGDCSMIPNPTIER